MGFLETIESEFSDLNSVESATRLITRLIMAGVLGGILGFERECAGKSAGLRTHVMLTMGTAFFVMVPNLLGMDGAALSRVFQGILPGIGFLGAGTILKHTEERRIEGLTTAAGVWFAAAIGMATGLGRNVSAIAGTLVGLLILALLPHVSQLRKSNILKPD